jgi:enamine deaminase RidA (YjgF/YER057c/UK114 family)
MQRVNYSSGAKWESIVGYSRAVKVGNLLEVTGTVAVNERGELMGGNDAYEQTKFILQKIKMVIEQAGGTLEDVVRTRLFVTDISRWEEYGKAHAEFFHSIRPCMTLVEVSKLISAEYLVEVEATAVLGV